MKTEKLIGDNAAAVSAVLETKHVPTAAVVDEICTRKRFPNLTMTHEEIIRAAQEVIGENECCTTS